MNSKLTTAALAALFIATTAHTAHATPTEEVFTQQMRVEFRRSDIANEAGARRLLEQLERASRRVCDRSGPGLNAGGNYRSCVQNARAEAVQKINAPMLTAVFESTPPIQLARR